MKCDCCKWKILYTYFKHCTDVINLCYDCWLNVFDAKWYKFYKHPKFVNEFVLEFEKSDKYEDKKKNEKAKVSHDNLLNEIFLLYTEIFKWISLPDEKQRWMLWKIKKIK